jgi:type VI secretion system secreted protein Hcp
MLKELLPRSRRSRVLALVLAGVSLTAAGAVARAADNARGPAGGGQEGPFGSLGWGRQVPQTIGTMTVDGKAFEIHDFDFSVENPTTIGSATGGAGAGKIKFNEFTIKKSADTASLPFFNNLLGGNNYQNVTVAVRKAGGDPRSAGVPYLTFKFDTVFTTKIDWSGPGDEGPEESITFVYGQLEVTFPSDDGGVSSSGVLAAQ